MATDKLIYNYIVDLRKKELSNFERAKIIRQYLDDEHISMREMARRFDIARSTIDDWLRWENLSETEYEEMKKEGLNDTEIYRKLRMSDEPRPATIKPIDAELTRFIERFKIFKLNPPYSDNTSILLDDTIKLLKIIKDNIEKRREKE
jgi:transposase-like protein